MYSIMRVNFWLRAGGHQVARPRVVEGLRGALDDDLLRTRRLERGDGNIVMSFIGVVRGPLVSGPLILSLYIHSYPYLYKHFAQ